MTAAEVLAAPEVTEPGVYPDLHEDDYHADPVPGGSLSSSGARKLLPPSCPAIFRHEQLHGSPKKRTFDLGHAAHKAVLGVGADVVTVDADDWKTKAAREQRDTAHAAGKVPLLAHEVAQVDAMAAAIRQHPMASALFNPERGGKPEQSLFWRQQIPVATPDRQQQVWRRARLDWLPKLTPGGRLILADYKTAACAEPGAFRKTAFNLGYHVQAAWYIDAVSALGLAEDIAFVFVVQEKTAPYPVTVCELDHDALRIGRVLSQQALSIYADCQRTDRWPGYSDQVELISPPPWVVNEFKDLL
ncbi:PD-(D/E)XK nuclease-like domain-containing protein [Geodermatophilus chilensis]|uniref:PD-(D/E)XK nuclease-like domain-containing protein n=1 Tax=Geodermatophilus chilensis TaxID=2035835 RepID=UPI000C262CF6|nr:PD-(D/E)XK nuclease-like domain-containing protein [Geodermatophilus chilensis]